MRENRLEAVVGALVLLGAAGFLALALGASGPRGGYPLIASFRSVDGIAAGSPVRMAGVPIGQVTSVRLDAETFRAQTEIRIRDGVAVPEDSTVAISSDGLLGDSFIDIVPGGAFTTLSPGDEIVDTQGAVSLIGLLMKFIAAQEG